MRDNTTSNAQDYSDLIDEALTKESAARATNAICQLWDDSKATFWRDTEHRTKEEKSPLPTRDFFPTVSYKSTEALLDLISKRPEWIREGVAKALRDTYIPRVFSRSLEEAESSLDITEEAGIQNPFTISLYIVTLANAFGAVTLDQEDTVRKLVSAINLLDDCCKGEGHSDLSRIHPFIQFHILRAFEACLPLLEKHTDITAYRELTRRSLISIKLSTERLLARHMLGQLAPSEAVALIFCAASLAITGEDENSHYVLPALEVGFKAQDSSGCWPLGRVIREDKEKEGAKLEISTYEIAWAVSETILRLAANKRESLLNKRAEDSIDRLVLAGRYAQTSSVEIPTEMPPRRGWCSDHPYGKPLIESWTSATVLQSVISLHELIEQRNKEEILRSFVTVDPRSEDWPSWLRWDIFKTESEPEDDHRILDYLDKHIVVPINENPRNLPTDKKESVSALLFGPPGTSKTTLVKGVADGLRWPVVMLSPGDFIKEGLEYIEAQARFVFDRLLRLSRVVVIFDECDELFRDRKPSAEVEQIRNITAFVTASMLPKLQELHDRGKVVFFICTNKFETLDPAIKRSGRIDHIIGVGPPQENARERIIRKALESLPNDDLKKVMVEELASYTDGFIRKEIERACAMLIHLKNWTNEGEARKAARIVAERLKDSLTISDTEYVEFKRLKRQFSRPVTEGASDDA